MADKIVQLINKDGDNIFPVSAAQTADTATINDGAVTTAKLANGAVTKGKIDWSTIGPQWFTIATSDVSSAEIAYTSNKGNTYTANTLNGGSGLRITNGAANIKKVRGSTSFYLSNTATGTQLSMHCIKPGGNLYTASTGGIDESTVISPAKITRTAGSSEEWSPVGIGSGNVLGGHFEYVGVRRADSTDRWTFDITFVAVGKAMMVTYGVECTAKDANSIPCPYLGGVGSLGQYAHCIVEVLEES